MADLATASIARSAAAQAPAPSAGVPNAAAQERPPYVAFDPGRCAVAPPLVDRLARRDDPDSTAWVPVKDTLLRSTRDSIAMCDAVYQGMTELDRHLLSLARVKLAMGDDAAARAARQRYIATLSSRPTREQGWAYFLIFRDNLEARPRRMAGAHEALAQIDALPFVDTWKVSLMAHASMAGEARTLWDEPLAKAEANVTIAKWKQLTLEQRTGQANTAAGMYVLKAEQELRLVNIASARAVLDTARATIPGNTRAYRGMLELTRLYSKVGLPAPAIDAQYWFRAPDATPRPAQRRVTFVSTAQHDCGLGCYGRYRGLGRYERRYGPQGLELINLSQTWGFYADTAPLPPLVEARHDSLYFFAHTRLPGMLAVYETKYTWKPDGRRRNVPTPQEVNYAFASVIIIDKQGIVRYVSWGWENVLEAPLATFIEKLLAEPGPSSAAPVHP